MGKKKSTLESLTAEKILAERARRQKCEEELLKLSQELDEIESSDDDDVLKDFSNRSFLGKSSGSDTSDVNYEFKNYGHTVFYSGISENIKGDEILSLLDEDDQNIFWELLSYQFWSKLHRYFMERNFNVRTICFMLMTSSLEHSELCKQFLLSETNTWTPSFNDILQVFIRWGASPHCLKIGEEAIPALDVSCEDSDYPSSSSQMSTTSCTQNTASMNNPLEMSDEQIELMRTMLEYLNECLIKASIRSADAYNLVIILSKLSTDKNCMKVLHLISSLISLLLNSQSSFNDIDARDLAGNLLDFETNTVNKVFICTNVLPKSARGQLLATYFSFYITQNILGTEITQLDVKSLVPVLDMFKNHGEKIRQLSPANIYFFVLSLTTLVYSLKVTNLDVNEFTEFLEHIQRIKKLPQIQVRDSNLKFISNFVEWCSTLWSFSLDERRESKFFESPKKSPRKSPKKRAARTAAKK